jgi:mannose PTS system EIID component
MMKRSMLLNIFIRSLTVQASFNFWRLQNLGFTFAMLPLIRRQSEDRTRIAELVTAHMQMFNTHPYMASSVIGAVARLEEEGRTGEVAGLKKALMGPYAAIGDSFFWGALRSFSAVGAVIAVSEEVWPALLVFLLSYSPAHLWVRAMGFLEGYRRGRNGIDFIRRLDLPAMVGKVRFLSLILIGGLAAIAVDTTCRSWTFVPAVPATAMATFMFLLFFLGVRRRISAVRMLYGMSLLCMVLSI